MSGDTDNGNEWQEIRCGDLAILADHGNVEVILGIEPNGEPMTTKIVMNPVGAFVFAQTVLQAAADARAQAEEIEAESAMEADRILRALDPMMRVGARP